MLFVKYYKITHDSHDCGNKNMHSTTAASLLAFLKYSHTLLSICFLFCAILSKVFLYPQIITICCYCRCSSITQNIVKPQLWSTWIFIVVMGEIVCLNYGTTADTSYFFAFDVTCPCIHICKLKSYYTQTYPAFILRSADCFMFITLLYMANHL